MHLRTKYSYQLCQSVLQYRIVEWEFVDLAELHPHKASVALQHEPEQQKLLVVPPYGFQVTKNNSHMYLILELTIAGNSLGSASSNTYISLPC